MGIPTMQESLENVHGVDGVSGLEDARAGVYDGSREITVERGVELDDLSAVIVVASKDGAGAPVRVRVRYAIADVMVFEDGSLDGIDGLDGWGSWGGAPELAPDERRTLLSALASYGAYEVLRSAACGPAILRLAARPLVIEENVNPWVQVVLVTDGAVRAAVALDMVTVEAA